MTHYPLYINGTMVFTSRRQEVCNPASQETIAEVSVAGDKETEQAIACARASFDGGEWSNRSPALRSETLLKIASGILEKAQELARLETLNTGKPIKETTFMDIPSSAKTFEHFAGCLQRYLAAETVAIGEEATGRLIREPRGVVAIIVPWNYPLLIASWKLAAALAAGNTVVIKPSSLTPLTALALASIIDGAGVPAGTVNILNGSGASVGEMLTRDPRIDMVSFTGSTEVGRRIIAGSASHVKKLVMELGGKSASLVFADCDREAAVNGSLCSIFLNQGQMCTAMSRILVEERIYQPFVEEFVKKAKKITLGDGLSYETQMGPLISKEQRSRLIDAVGKAVKEGARVLCGGGIPKDEALRRGFFFEPTLLGEVREETNICKDEVFGPVACISPFAAENEAIKRANRCDFALAACIWTKDAVRADRVAASLDAGTVWVNTYGMFYPQLPYGGFKQSGFGKELGREGFLEYTRLKNVVSSREEKPLVSYWYGF